MLSFYRYLKWKLSIFHWMHWRIQGLILELWREGSSNITPPAISLYYSWGGGLNEPPPPQPKRGVWRPSPGGKFKDLTYFNAIVVHKINPFVCISIKHVDQ